MGPGLVVMDWIGSENPAQLACPELEHMVQAFASDRADQPLRIGILLGRPMCRRVATGGRCPEPLVDELAIDGVTITDQIVRRLVAGKGLRDLAGDPFRRGMSSNLESQ
jgi:hypothetical protein